MKIEEQVISLEQAIRLKELGVMQDSFWEYADGILKMAFTMNKGERFSTFTVAELGVMLPEELYVPYKGNSGKKRRYPQHVHIFKQLHWSVNYTGGGSREFLTQHGNTEAEARAAMLIYLLENNLIKVDEVNKRLLSA